jgi:DNA-binding MarR family transcriptional regulator
MYKHIYATFAGTMKICDSKYCGCLYYSVNALSRIMTKMAEEEFASTGLTPSYAFVLMSVNSNPGIHPKALSEHMLLTPSTVTRLIDKLEARGLIERKISGRITEIHPTPKSLELDNKIKSAWRNLYTRYSSLLGEVESSELNKRINEAVDLITE